MKTCKSCGQLKHESEFHLRLGKRRTVCKTCRAIQKKLPSERARKSCKCLTCENENRFITVALGQETLIRGEEACYLDCERCATLPSSTCGYKPMMQVG